jgi:PKHD-type hydroxylase
MVTTPTPNPNLHVTATVRGYFTPRECERIVALGKSQLAHDATIMTPEAAGPTIDRSKRSNSVTWFKQGDAATQALQAKLGRLVQDVNKDVYHFDLAGFGEALQFTLYESICDTYTWHQDLGIGNTSTRKLSVIVQLSDPATYRGCDLQIYKEGEPAAVERNQGTVLIFPAWTLHRVTPLEEGVRYSLVAWISGEPFR